MEPQERDITQQVVELWEETHGGSRHEILVSEVSVGSKQLAQMSEGEEWKMEGFIYIINARSSCACQVAFGCATS